MPSKLEAELMKATKVKQAAGEGRKAYLVRMLKAGQDVKAPAWDALSGEAQAWYNDSVRLYQAHTNPNDIKEFPDYVQPTTRATLSVAAAPIDPEPETEEEAPEADEPPVEEDEPEADEPAVEEDEPAVEEADDAPLDEPEEDEFEEDEPPVEEEPEPPLAAAPTKRPAAKPAKAPVRKPPPAVKTPSKGPVKTVKVAKTDGVVTRPPKPAAPGASTVIKRLMLRNPDVTNAELIEKLKEKSISVTSISVSTIRSDFKHSIRVLQEAGYCQELPAP